MKTEESYLSTRCRRIQGKSCKNRNRNYKNCGDNKHDGDNNNCNVCNKNAANV